MITERKLPVTIRRFSVCFLATFRKKTLNRISLPSEKCCVNKPKKHVLAGHNNPAIQYKSINLEKLITLSCTNIVGAYQVPCLSVSLN